MKKQLVAAVAQCIITFSIFLKALLFPSRTKATLIEPNPGLSPIPSHTDVSTPANNTPAATIRAEGEPSVGQTTEGSTENAALTEPDIEGGGGNHGPRWWRSNPSVLVWGLRDIVIQALHKIGNKWSRFPTSVSLIIALASHITFTRGSDMGYLNALKTQFDHQNHMTDSLKDAKAGLSTWLRPAEDKAAEVEKLRSQVQEMGALRMEVAEVDTLLAQVAELDILRSQMEKLELLRA
ncbi:hypothetical protein M422DRAFT_251648 [Sphaerobolus stellatus SS14]|uniref:Uncharacterized protein n=1 Tax=Sphaerobolus stellatus (strain SS14) TaxID=990650 RepID=A0A0C9VDA8_SPHS4|nr:hypothetical protein M422DRAFT_251648 [Sphaerobolus stellatus SS14]